MRVPPVIILKTNSDLTFIPLKACVLRIFKFVLEQNVNSSSHYFWNHSHS